MTTLVNFDFNTYNHKINSMCDWCYEKYGTPFWGTSPINKVQEFYYSDQRNGRLCEDHKWSCDVKVIYGEWSSFFQFTFPNVNDALMFKLFW